MVAAAAVSFICDELSEQEKQRQRKMQNEYHEYEYRRRQEYRQTCSYYENARQQSEEEYRHAIRQYQLELIEKRKRENRNVYNQIQNFLNEQYLEKEKLLNECIEIQHLCEKSIDKQQNTFLRFKSIKTTLVSLEEAVYKLEAYLEYLSNYKSRFTATFEESGEVLEPFSMTLPKSYPYEGQLIFLSKEDSVNGGYVFEEAGYIRIEQSDIKAMEQCGTTVKLPFMMYKSKTGKKYLSLSRGMLKNSIGGTLGIDTEVKEIKHKYIRLLFMGNEYIRISISKDCLINQRRKTPVGSNLHVYISDYDYALKKQIKVSEKVGDGLSIAQFDSIIMLQTLTERNEFFAYLEKNNLLDEDDEWRIAPVWDENKKILEGIIMQVGNEYAFKAFFEEIETGKLALRYRGMIEREQFISFDDVFVTTNVTVDCLSPVQDDLSEHELLFEECQKLQLYLISEFMTQSKMMKNSPMTVYLNQWTEITNRLIELMEYGGHFSLNICEIDSIRIIGENFTILYIDNESSLKKFIEKENGKGRYRFFIQYSDYEKLQCWIQNIDDQISIKVKGEIATGDLIERNFILDLYSIAVPYVERQHANALDSFREGRVVNENLKIALINIKDETYSDNGFRIAKFYNNNICANDAQVEAVIRSFAEEKIFMIQGPPGTGKTTVIKELILQELNRESNSKILVVSQANVAVDNVLRGIVEIIKETHFIESGQIVRCGTADKIADDIEDYSFENKYSFYNQKLKNSSVLDETVRTLREKWITIIENKDNSDVVGECLLGCFQIIGATCVGLENRHYGLSGMEFDLVIIDEAGKALAGELLIPINRAKKTIIIGDHKQLPPVINPALYKGGEIEYKDVVEEEQQEDFLNRSFFQRLYEECPNTMKCMLKTQFRMPPVIANLVNIFYDGQLETGENCYSKKPLFLGNNLIFIDMKNDVKYVETQNSYDGKRQGSPYNVEEVEATKKIVEKIRRYYDKRIVIITPYKKQKFMLQKAFNDRNVWVNTIDAFQGDEEDIVIYCTTRAKKQTKYFSDSARLNVAFSRARNTLIFLGSSDYLRSYPETHILHQVSKYMIQNACVVNFEEWVKSDFDLKYDQTYFQKMPQYRIIPLTEIDAQRFFESVTKKTQAERKCGCCGRPLEEDEKILCGTCILRSETVKCQCCDAEIPYSFYEKYVLRTKSMVVCENCLEVTCQECGEVLFIVKKKYEKLIGTGRKCLCINCQKKYAEKINLHCKECDKEFQITFAQKRKSEEMGKSLYNLCDDCVRLYREPIVRKCTQCGAEIKSKYSFLKKLESEGKKPYNICSECREQGNRLMPIGTCEACGNAILQKAYIIKKFGKGDHRLHPECRERVYLPCSCKKCGKAFDITYGEKESYESKGLNLPKKCKECRGQ